MNNTRKKDGKHIAEAFGMLVTSENVFVCSWRNGCICVFDLNITLCYSPELNHFWLIGTAKFKDCSIVTSEVAIEVIKKELKC